ncbi:hypothetical protein BHM03_00037128 [Ensete ventricosum]|nr:hypothetical protein BHM03_00037128 [Ensete ventricosum]
MDRLYKVTEVRGEPMIACFKCQMREAAEVMEMRSLMVCQWEGEGRMKQARQRAGVVGSKVDGRATREGEQRKQRPVNYDDVPGAGGYHWFYDPFSVAHAALCVEEDDDVAGQ